MLGNLLLGAKQFSKIRIEKEGKGEKNDKNTVVTSERV